MLKHLLSPLSYSNHLKYRFPKAPGLWRVQGRALAFLSLLPRNLPPYPPRLGREGVEEGR